MNIGTKSILFGAHQFILHPLFVARAWWKLYGFPWDPRLWVAFFVHDLGYWGKPNMDGPEGDRHVELGAEIMHFLFDGHSFVTCPWSLFRGMRIKSFKWHDFSLYHSRFTAKREGKPFSRLCVADKYSICLMPAWLYLPLVRLTGEIYEYMALAASRTAAGEPKYASMKLSTNSQQRWFYDVQEYLRRWCMEHKDGRPDQWTPDLRTATTDSGVWK